MTIFKKLEPDCRGYTDKFVCNKCGAIIQYPYCDTECDYNYCPYCGDKEADNDKIN